jgi:molecular chaperone GrpE (heat shock protein)
MEVLKEEIESILYRHDIEVLALGESNKMDTQLHKVIKREITLEENLANTVVIVRQGLTYQDTIIRKHEVILRTLTND